MTQWLQDRWFRTGIHFFGVCLLVSLALVTLSGVAPITALGGIALSAAALGMGICMLGLRVCNPLQWSASVARIRWWLASARDQIALHA